MPSIINVHLLPELTSAEALAGKTVAVIDVLRATTTITWALAAGAKQVVPCLEVEEAVKLKGQGSGDVMLGGERGGLRIDDFDLGNSPTEYTSETVSGKTVVFTTTNGTKAMMLCRQAQRVLIAAFVNLSAVCRVLAGAGEVALLCAGTRGEITREDVLMAGAIVDRLKRDSSDELNLNDEATIAADAWRSAVGDEHERLVDALKNSHGGRNLIGINLEVDIATAARIDVFDVAPELHVADWKITLSAGSEGASLNLP